MGYIVEIVRTRTRKGEEHSQSRFSTHIADIIMLIEKAQSLHLRNHLEHMSKSYDTPAIKFH